MNRIVNWICIALFLASCTPARTAPQQTADAVMVQAQIAMDGELAAAGLLGSYQIDAVLPQLIAIENNLAGSKGAWMWLNQCGKIAVFVTQAGKGITGQMIYYIGTVDVRAGKLIDTANVLADYGIDFKSINTFDDIEQALRNRGFSRMLPASVPVLYQTLQLALSFIKSLSSSAVDLMIVPAGMLTPEMILPYCGNEIDCVGIDS